MTFKSSEVSEFLERRDLGEICWLVKVAGSCCWIHIASCFPKVALGSWGCCSVTQSCPALRPHGRQHTRLPCPSPSRRACSNPYPLRELMPPNYPVLCRPFLFLPSICPSIRVFSNESALCIRWPKYCSFSFNISPSNEYSRLISLRIDWFDLLEVQWTLKSHLQHWSSKASILQSTVIFMVQLSHPYMTTGKTIALTRWTFGELRLSGRIK